MKCIVLLVWMDIIEGLWNYFQILEIILLNYRRGIRNLYGQNDVINHFKR
jgi:hypothetical protein